MKKAYVVVGPESSGTRLITKLLIDAGCFGDGGHGQSLDKSGDQSREFLEESRLPQDDTPIVWRRSYPHAGKWLDISKPISQLQRKGYEVRVVVTTRDWFPMIQSQMKERHVKDETVGLHNVQKAYRMIFEKLPKDTPFVIASYESIARYRWKAVRRLFETLQVWKPRLVKTITDENFKWYFGKEKRPPASGRRSP
jgi:LPS sulfotransferase NodH